jgi:hypothetical protein
MKNIQKKKNAGRKYLSQDGVQAFDPARCKAEVWDDPVGIYSHQCEHPRGYGYGKRYCRSCAEAMEPMRQWQIAQRKGQAMILTESAPPSGEVPVEVMVADPAKPTEAEVAAEQSKGRRTRSQGQRWQSISVIRSSKHEQN